MRHQFTANCLPAKRVQSRYDKVPLAIKRSTEFNGFGQAENYERLAIRIRSVNAIELEDIKLAYRVFPLELNQRSKG